MIMAKQWKVSSEIWDFYCECICESVLYVKMSIQIQIVRLKSQIEANRLK